MPSPLQISPTELFFRASVTLRMHGTFSCGTIFSLWATDGLAFHPGCYQGETKGSQGRFRGVSVGIGVETWSRGLGFPSQEGAEMK